MDKKYIGTYIIVLSLSGISFIVSMLFIISNITYIKEGGNIGFNYFYWLVIFYYYFLNNFLY